MMAYVVLTVSCEIYRLKCSCLLLLTFLLHFVTFLYSLGLKFKNYSSSIVAYVRHLNDTGAFTVCHNIFTIMYRRTQKKREVLKNPTKIEEIQEKTFIDRN